MKETRLKLPSRDTVNSQLSSRVLMLSALAILTLIGLIIAVLYISFRDAQTKVDTEVNQSVLVFTKFTGKLESDLKATSNALTHTDNTTWTTVLRDLLERQRAIFEAVVIDPQGKILASRNRVGGKSSDIDKGQPWLEIVKKNNGFYIGVLDYQQFGVPFVDVAVAIYDDNGKFVGTLLAKTDFTALWELIVRIHVGESGYAYVANSNGEVMTYRDLDLVKNGLSMFATTGHGPQDVVNLPWQVLPGLDNKSVIAGGALLGDTPWYVIVEQPVREAFSLFFRLLAIFILILVFVSWQAHSAVTFAQKRVILPIKKLAMGTDEMQKGNLAFRVDIQTNDELGNLASAFNAMAASLQQSIQTLEQRVNERTRDLNIASDVSRQITRELDMGILLPELVKKTRAGFRLYYVSVFIYHPQTQELLLEAGTGVVGERMKAEAKAFHLNAKPSLVAQAARERQSVIINDVTQSVDHFINPHLPDTRAEATFPMVVGDELVGVLNLQSETINRFRESDTQIFTTLAEQIAIAVRNAQLYREQAHVAQELERTDRMKTQFLTGMSHELRTPLNAIINFTQMVGLGMAGNVTDEQKDLMGQATNSSKHLLQLINDVLDIGKIQAGKLTLFVEHDVNLYREIESALSMIGGVVEDKGVALANDIDDNLPLVSGDKRRIRQIILNLLSNAAKFTEQGTITLSAKLRDDKVVIAVIDTGPGIPESAQEMIFEAFTQTEDGVKVEGTGLGLPISRSLAQAHGGDLWVESKPGEGSAFYFTLPIKGEKTS